MIIKKIPIVATCAALSCGAVGTAYAGASAFALLDVLDAQLIRVDTGQQLDLVDLSNLPNFGFNSLNTSFLNGNPGIPTNDQSVSCIGLACGGIGENNFNQQLPQQGNGNFSRADAQGILAGPGLVSDATGIVGAPVARGAASAGVRSLSENQAASDGSNAQAGNTSSLNTSATFVAGFSSILQFNFNASGFVEAFLDGTAAAGSAADASTTWNVLIEDLTNGVTILEWAPDGIAGNAIIGNDLLDPDSIQLLAAVNGPGPQVSTDTVALGAYSATTSIALVTGNLYNISINHDTAANSNKVIQQVPEPGVLALLGMSLFGIGAMRRQRKS